MLPSSFALDWDGRTQPCTFCTLQVQLKKPIFFPHELTNQEITDAVSFTSLALISREPFFTHTEAGLK